MRKGTVTVPDVGGPGTEAKVVAAPATDNTSAFPNPPVQLLGMVNLTVPATSSSSWAAWVQVLPLSGMSVAPPCFATTDVPRARALTLPGPAAPPGFDGPPFPSEGPPLPSGGPAWPSDGPPLPSGGRSEEHTSELQSRQYLVCRLLLEKKKKKKK